MPTGIGPLATMRVQAILEEIEGNGQNDPRLFLGRVPRVPASDEEITARVTGDVVAADLVADDQAAPIKSADVYTMTTTKIPNLKHGRQFMQKQINLLERINSGAANARELQIFDNYVFNALRKLLRGVEDRMEMLLASMVADAGTYNRFGITMSNMTWGMPADLKVTAAVPWSTAATATPVSDLQALINAGKTHGVAYDRVTMSTQAFRYMTATVEFREQARFYNQIEINATGFPTQNDRIMTTLAVQMLGLEIELYDAMTKIESYEGAHTAERFLPENKVILSSRAFDNDEDTWDFANGTVTETTLRDFVNMPFGTFDGPSEGPVAYATVANPQLNPPGIILWAVARGFPRKHNVAASACLTAY